MIVASIRELGEANCNADVIEFRLDLFSEFPSKDEIRAVKKPKILTVRRPEDGGKFEGSEEERLKIFKRYSPLFDYADIEVYAKDEFLEIPCKIIESYHNFKLTPSYEELKDMVEGRRGEIFKIAVMGRDKRDVVTITRILSDFEDVVAFLMGEAFSFTRVLAVAMGSPFIYCSVGKAVAPGQLSINEAKAILKTIGLVRE